MSKIHCFQLVLETDLFLLQIGQRTMASAYEPAQTSYFKISIAYSLHQTYELQENLYIITQMLNA